MTRHRQITDIESWLPHPVPLRYRLAVLAPSVTNLVTSAGGWLFDRVSAGWDVTVLLTECDAERPLHILGARTVELCTADACVRQVRQGRALALSTELLSDSHLLRTALRPALRERRMAISLWGDPRLAEFEHGVRPLTYPLSTAARAFKTHALMAAGAPQEPVGPTEVFRSVGTSRAAAGCALPPA